MRFCGKAWGKATDGTRDQSYTQEGCAARSRQGSVARVSKQRAHSVGSAAAAAVTRVLSSTISSTMCAASAKTAAVTMPARWCERQFAGWKRLYLVPSRPRRVGVEAVKKLLGVAPRSASDVVAHLTRASKIGGGGEAVGARGASGGGPSGCALLDTGFSGVGAFACPCRFFHFFFLPTPILSYLSIHPQQAGSRRPIFTLQTTA